MAKVEKPELFYGNYVKFELKNTSSECPSKGKAVNWSYIPYVHDYKTLFLRTANGDIVDFKTMQKVSVIDFQILTSLQVDTPQLCVTNLVPSATYYCDEYNLLDNPILITGLINNYFEHFGGWINIKNISLDDKGLFEYNGKLTKEQELIMTAEEIIDHSLEFGNTSANNISYDVPENLYLAFVVKKMNVPYQEGILTNIYKMFPEVKLLQKTDDGYIDFVTKNKIKEFFVSDMEESVFKSIYFANNNLYAQEIVGYCNFINLENFLITSSITINPKKDIASQINPYYNDVDPVILNQRIPNIPYPSLESVLKRNLNKK